MIKLYAAVRRTSMYVFICIYTCHVFLLLLCVAILLLLLQFSADAVRHRVPNGTFVAVLHCI